MTAPSEHQSSVCKRFLEHNFSDCKLSAIRTDRAVGSDEEVLHLDLLLVSGENADQWLPATLTFIDLGWIKADIDFWAKKQCSDTIEEGTCEYGTDAASSALAEHPGRSKTQNVADFLLFTLRLCSPSGSLEVFAKDFVLR